MNNTAFTYKVEFQDYLKWNGHGRLTLIKINTATGSELKNAIAFPKYKNKQMYQFYLLIKDLINNK